MRLVPTTSRLPASGRSLPVCCHDANSAIAAAATLVTTAFSSRACPLLSRKLHLLPRVVPAGREHRSQDKVCCPVRAFSTMDHIYKTDLNMKDVLQPSPQSSLRVCPSPTAHLGVQTQNHPCCVTLKPFQSPAFVSFQACLQVEERKGVKRRQNG